MKKLPYLIVLVFLAGFSCQEKAEEPTFEACGVQNPVQDLTWLAEITSSSEPSGLGSYFFITQAEYIGETVFIMRNCCPHCNTVITVHNCEGTMLGVVGRNSEIDANLILIDASSILNERTIWKPVNSSCFN